MKVIFSGNWLPGSAAIRILTQARWHHCGVIRGDTVIESRMFKGVTLTDIDEFKARGKWAIIDIPMSEEQEDIAINFMLGETGSGYDYSGIFAVLFVRREWQNPRKWYCSEIIAAACAAANKPIARTKVAGVSPRDIWIQAFECTESNVPELVTRLEV